MLNVLERLTCLAMTLALLVSALSGCAQSGPSHGSSASNEAAHGDVPITTPSQEPPSQAVISGTNGIPMYAGGQLLSSVRRDETTQRGGAVIRTADQPTVALQLYVRALKERGWEVAAEQEGQERGWANLISISGSASMPARRALYVTLSRNSKGGSDIILDFASWPDPNRVPLHPDARGVAQSWAAGPIHGTPAHVTIYVTPASAAEVKGYYERIMPQEGWAASPEAPDPGLAFNYSNADPYGKTAETWSYVSVALQQLASGETKVELQASGSEVNK